jgi:hypothetical protein
MATFARKPDFGQISVTVRLRSGAEVRLNIANRASIKKLKQSIVALEHAATAIAPSPCTESEGVKELLTKLQLQQYEAALVTLGATAMQHLRHVTEADLAIVGLQPLERQRLLAALVAQPVVHASVRLPSCGDAVTLNKLVGRQELNGVRGQVVSFDGTSGRYVVRLPPSRLLQATADGATASDCGEQLLKLRPECLTVELPLPNC